MYRSSLLLVGCVFLSFALLGAGYLFMLGRPGELQGLINIAGVAPGPTSTGIAVIAPTDTVPAGEPTATPMPSDTPAPLDTPTASPTATVTATRAAFARLTFCVTSPPARLITVRSGPGTHFPPLGKPVRVGTCLDFDARNEESTWLKIAADQSDRTLRQYEGGWIARELLGLGSTGPIALPAVTLTPTPRPRGAAVVTPTFTPTLPVLGEASFPILFFKPVLHAQMDSGMSKPDRAARSDNFLVEAEWPARLEAGGSGTIRVSLVRTSAGYVPTVQINGNTAEVFTPIPVGTPGLDLGAAFGHDYVAKNAVAGISGASFHIDPVLPAERQMLDQPQIAWTWNISPDTDTALKDQGIDVTIQIEWQRIDNEADVKAPVIWREHMKIDVFQSPIKAGQVSVLSIVSGFLGSGLSIPWLYERLSKRKSQQRRKPKKRS